MLWLCDFVYKTRGKDNLEMTGMFLKKSCIAVVVVVAFYFLKALSIIHQKEGAWNSLACDL